MKQYKLTIKINNFYNIVGIHVKNAFAQSQLKECVTGRPKQGPQTTVRKHTEETRIFQDQCKKKPL